ncbi:O-antigen ligase family protein [Candidatus Proelusimicrobium volucris]|uniref:O-antigen ligase family protein n=1 Tax=Candidatus Proelusimicrobium volucris TaxID=3416225 RepID=UPI003D14FB15
MKDRILNISGTARKLFLAGMVFMAPLVFFTDLTKNPYIAQDLLLSLLMSGFLICWSAEVFIKRELKLAYGVADLFMLLFAAISLASLFYNLASGGKFLALIGDFSQKGDVFVFSFVGGWFLAKYIGSWKWEKFRGEFYFNLLLWCFAWFLFNLFSGIFFWIYAAFMWFWAGYVCLKRLDKVTPFALLDVFTAVCAICGLYGILQNAGLEMIWQININYEFGSRAVSTFGNPNFLSSYLVIFLPMVFLRFMKAKSGGEKFTFFAILVIICAYLAISMTRSSWLGVAGAGALLLLFKDFRALLLKNKMRAAAIIAVCFAVFFLWPSGQGGDKYSPAASQRMAELNDLNDASAFGLGAPADKLNAAYHQRLMMWACGLEMFKESPLLGKGLTSFQTNYGLCQGGLMFKNPALGQLKTQANEAHNQFVQVLAESGLLGFISFICLLVAVFWGLWKAVRAEKNEDLRLAYLCLGAGLAAFILDNTLNITFRAVITAFAFWFVFGMLNNLRRAEKTKKIGGVCAWSILFSGIMIAVLFGAWQVGYFKAEITALKGYKAFAKGEYAQAEVFLKEADANAAIRADAAFSVVNALIEERKYQEALEYALRGIKKYPGYYEFYLRAAGVKSGLGDNIGAAQYLKEALELYPNNLAAAQAWSKFVAALPKLRTADNAETAENLSKMFPYDTDIKLAYLLASFESGEYDKACIKGTEFLAEDIFNPDYYDIVKKCGAEGFPNEDLVKKADLFKKVRGRIKAEKYNSALEKEAEKFYAKYPQDANAGLLLAEVKYNGGKYKEAADILMPHYLANKHQKPISFALSSAYLKAGEKEKAKEVLEGILAYDAHDEQALLRLKRMSDK